MGEDQNKNQVFKNWLNKIKGKLDTKKVKYLTVIILSVVVVFILLSSSTRSVKKTVTSQIETTTNSSWREYCESQEHRLEYVLSSIKGVDDVKVFIMVDTSPELTYLQNSTKTTSASASESYQTTAVEVKNGNITTPVVVLESLPKIVGVLVVAGGASDVKLKNTIANVVSSVVKVSLSSVEVLEGK